MTEEEGVITLSEEKWASVVVWRLAESDDWDGAARVGMAHRDFASVDLVLRESEDGWWERAFVPYLVFHNHAGLIDAAARLEHDCGYRCI